MSTLWRLLDFWAKMLEAALAQDSMFNSTQAGYAWLRLACPAWQHGLAWHDISRQASHGMTWLGMACPNLGQNAAFSIMWFSA